MMCCSYTGFCTVADFYQEKDEGGASVGTTEGPTARLRNVVPHLQKSRRIVYSDRYRSFIAMFYMEHSRYYTMLAVAIQLLAFGIYIVGTCKTDSSCHSNAKQLQASAG